MFLVATHTATALVLLLFFRKDWVRIVKGFLRTVTERKIRPDDIDARLAWILIVGTIPAGLVGLTFKLFIRAQLLSSYYAAVFLTLNGVLLFVAELLRRNAPLSNEQDSDQRIYMMSWWQGFKVGVCRCLRSCLGSRGPGRRLPDRFSSACLMKTP